MLGGTTSASRSRSASAFGTLAKGSGSGSRASFRPSGLVAGQMFACSQFGQLALRINRGGIALRGCLCSLPGVDGHGEAPEVREGKGQGFSHRRRAIDRRQ